VDFVRGAKDRPWCLSVSFHAPHAQDNHEDQYIWPAALDGLYDDIDIPLPPTAEPAFFAELPEFLQESLGRVRWRWRFDTPEKRVRMMRGYYRMITGVDRAFGRILDELDKLHLADHTVVIFSSDNGYFLGERGLAGKWLIHEPSIRVPLIVRDPRLPARRGATVGATALNIDFASTILDLAGVPVPDTYQGRSLMALVRGTDVPERKDFFYEHLFAHKKIPKSEGVRGKRFKYVRYFEEQPVHEELYDFVTDPHETKNLAADPGSAKVLDQLRNRCDELRDRYTKRAPR
jgi:arylsulfatase A-like enzyme